MSPNDRGRQGSTKRKKPGGKEEGEEGNIVPTDINSGGRTAMKMDCYDYCSQAAARWWWWWWPLPTTSRSKSIDHPTGTGRTIQIDNRRRGGLDPSRSPPRPPRPRASSGDGHTLLTRHHSKPACASAHHHHHPHPHQQLVIITLFMALILGQQATTTLAMLDALKALFILTGASTYLVTKYVNVTSNQTNAALGQQGYGYYYNLPVLVNNNNNNNNTLSTLNTSGSVFDPALNFLKDSKTPPQQQQQQQSPLSNLPASSLSSPPTSSLLRPVYVLAVQEEEDERRLPKSLFNLSISDRFEANGQPRRLSDIEYVLDSPLDDFEPVIESFQVNSTTGELFLIRPLDRDPPNGRASWKFSVQARQRRTQFILAIVDIHISVRDVNDNRPMFEQRTYRTSVMENGPAGQILTKVTAIDFDDADTADNGKVVYSLLKTPASSAAVNNQQQQQLQTTGRQRATAGDNFQLDPHSGVLTALACCFDREKRSSYELLARATDAGGLWDEATIIVTINDLNDCPPKFLEPPRSLVLNEDDIERFNQLGLPPSQNNNNSGHEGTMTTAIATKAFDENIYTFPVADDDLPESNHFHYEIVNATNCSLYQRFYMVANDDGSGTLFGTRTKLQGPLEYNKTYTCGLTISVQDMVRDSEAAIGEAYEDQTTLTLIYRNTTKPPETSNAAIKQTISEQQGPIEGHKESAVIVRNLTRSRSDDQSGPNGLKSYELGERQAPHSSCTLCQNGGRCVVTETGFRFRCHCRPGFDGALCERTATHGGRVAEIFREFDALLAKVANNRLFFIGTIIIFVNLFVVIGLFSFWLVRRIKQTTASPSPSSMSSASLPMPATMSLENHLSSAYRSPLDVNGHTTTTTLIMQSHPDIVLEATSTADRIYQQQHRTELIAPISVDINFAAAAGGQQFAAATLDEEEMSKFSRYQYLIG